jgi:hypothetical protein
MLAQFTATTLGFFGADEALQGGFQISNPSLEAVDVGFEFMNSFSICPLDGVQALGWSSGMAVFWLPLVGCASRGGDGFCKVSAPPCFAQIVFIIAGMTSTWPSPT